MGWGTSKWGTSPWGSGGGRLSVSNAFAAATDIVRVTLTAQPAASSPVAPGDALNPMTWQVVRLDTNVAFTVVSVAAYDPPFVYDIFTYEKFGSVLVEHTVTAVGLVSPDGDPAQSPLSANFLGVLTDQPRETQHESVDLANPPTPNEMQFGGTLQIGADGDYATDSGITLLKKLIFRRLTTRPGEFFHLPTYGIGLSVKEPLPISDLVKLKKQIELQIAQEPDVDQVAANLSFSNPLGILTVMLAVRVRPTGQTFDVNFKVSQDGIVQL